METKEGLDCGVLQVMMESLVSRVSLVKQDLQDTRHTQGVWKLRWPQGLTEKPDLKRC